MTDISQIRTLYQEHIRNTVKLIDLHSQLYTSTGYPFHTRSYDHLVKYVCELKQYIKDREAKEQGHDWTMEASYATVDDTDGDTQSATVDGELECLD